MTLALVAVATAVIFTFRGALPTVNLVSIIYLIPVLLASLWWGVWPAVLASIAGAMAADFFFYPPLYSLWISDTQNIADLIVFLIVALVSGNLAANLRQRESQIHDLYGFSKQLAACFTIADLIRATQDYLAQCLGHPTTLVEAKYIDDAGVPEAVRHNAGALLPQGAPASHTIFDPATRHLWLIRRVLLGTTDYVVCVDLGSGAVGARRTLNRRIDAVLTEAAANLQRLDLARAIDEARIQAQSDALKTALVTTMSHDLRNPLVSILGASSVLDQIAEIRGDARAQSLVRTVYDEAARLDSSIQNLIDAARITTGVERPKPQLTDPVDMVRAAVAQKNTRLAEHRVDVALAADLPLIQVQSALVENALAQLLDNAAKYSPAGATIKIEGRFDQENVVLSVSDEGAGLTPDERRHIGERSFRGNGHAAAIPGSGLGLWIANTFVAANGGRLEAESAGPGLGTTIRLRFPAARDTSRNIVRAR
jgi:K+-sensing histidine kinase KdpD